MSTDKQPAQRASSRVLGPMMLAAMINGVHLEEIAKREGMTVKRAEWIVRSELRRRWIAPLQEYARLQIARLEGLFEKLKAKAETGDLPSIDRLLKVLDRLDRYHGFSKLVAVSNAAQEDVRQKLMAKVEKTLRKPARPA
jgi:transcriptional regulator with XRE-family HTH domain